MRREMIFDVYKYVTFILISALSSCIILDVLHSLLWNLVVSSCKLSASIGPHEMLHILKTKRVSLQACVIQM